MKQEMMTPSLEANWFKTWFDSDYYHKLYRHRNDEEARTFIDALLDELQPAAGCAMLDLGCGAGRHSRYLAQKGFNVTGLDLSAASINKAKQSANGSLQFYQHDMRDPFGANRFHFVFNFFTSFGYFKNAQENEQVVENISTALKTNGIVMFDYINAAYAEDHLVPVEEIEIDGVIYHINRWADNHFIYKRIAIQDRRLHPLVYVEKVATFRLNDFNNFFHSHNLKTVKVYGDYSLNDYDENKSKRMIILAKKMA